MDTTLDIQLAKLAVKTGLITKEQLKDCLIEQELKKKRGVATQLSEIILEKEYATVPQLSKLTKSLEAEMQQTHSPQVSTAVENRASNASTATQTATKQIIEGYEIIEKLGSGAMGVVYKARQVNMDRLVALKVLPPKLAKNEQYRDRFLREARAAAKLNHENVVRAYDIGQSHGLYYFAMEFIDGSSVQDIMKDNGPFDEQTALEIVKQIAQGLAQAQKLNIVHRDIKPDNIMITSTKTAKLCDLGLAKQIDVDPQLTAHGAAVGTPWYISPEQAKGVRKIDTRADLYSLGATLFHMVCGGPPYIGPTAAVIMTKHINEPIPDPQKRKPHLSDSLVYIVKKMMAKTVADRFQSPEELIADITKYQVGDPVGPPLFVEPASTAPRTGATSSPKTASALQLQDPPGTRPQSSSRRFNQAERKTKTKKAKMRAAEVQQEMAKKWKIKIGVAIGVGIIMLILLGMLLGGGDDKPRPNHMNKTVIDNTEKDINKIPDPSVTKVSDEEKKRIEAERQRKILVERLTGEINTKLKAGRNQRAASQFSEAITTFISIEENKQYVEHVPELVKTATTEKNDTIKGAEELASQEFERITSAIENNGFIDDIAGSFFNKILAEWEKFNQGLQFTEFYKTKVAGETGIIKKTKDDAKQYFTDLKTKVDFYIKSNKFNEPFKIIGDAQLRLPDSYMDELNALIASVEEAQMKYIEQNEQRLKDLRENAPLEYDNFILLLKGALQRMDFAQAHELVEKALNDEKYTAHEEIRGKLQRDLVFVDTIQEPYYEIYSKIMALAKSGVIISAELDDKQVRVGIDKCDPIIGEMLFTIDKENLTLKISETRGSASRTLDEKFSTLDDQHMEMFTKWAYDQTQKSISEARQAVLFATFYTFHMPDKPDKPDKNHEIETAVLKALDNIDFLKQRGEHDKIHPIVYDMLKVAKEEAVKRLYSDAINNHRNWERKSKTLKEKYGKELADEIKLILKYFSDTTYLSDDDSRRLMQLEQWLKDVTGSSAADDNAESSGKYFNGKYKLKGNKIEIEYDFKDKKQIEDFTKTKGRHESAMMAYSEAKKAMMLTASGINMTNRTLSTAFVSWRPKVKGTEFEMEIEAEVVAGAIYGFSTHSTSAEKEYCTPLRAFVDLGFFKFDFPLAIYHGMPNFIAMAPDVEKKDTNEASVKAPYEGKFKFKITRDDKGNWTGWIDGKKIIQGKNDDFKEGFINFFAASSRIYITNIKIKTELDQDWLKTYFKQIDQGEDPRLDESDDGFKSDDEFKQALKDSFSGGGGMPGGGNWR